MLSETAGLLLERMIETELYRIDRFRRFTGDAPAPPQIVEKLPVVDEVDREVARFVLWGGGAKTQRDEATRDERRANRL